MTFCKTERIEGTFLKTKLYLLVIGLAFFAGIVQASAGRGAAVPWTTYEAENMTLGSGTVSGPGYSQNNVQSESSGRKCVRLHATGQYVQFTAQAAANAIVVRYSVPDTADGVGADYTLSLYTNGILAGELPLTSKYSWLYGSFPFTNAPAASSPRNFFDEVRVRGLTLRSKDVVRLQVGTNDTASFYDLDLVDLEEVAAPRAAPANFISILNYGADSTGTHDATAALRNCISAAASQGKSVWLPAGIYKITGLIKLPSNLMIQGAGMWFTTLVGDSALYANAARRITFKGAGSNIHLSDFAIVGKLNYRNDREPNDGLGGTYGRGSTISRIWVEHTKTGAWIINSQGLVMEDCRFRDTLADGCNICVGMQNTTVTNCTTRGTGDDGFALWPANYTQQVYAPGGNVFTHCTGQLSWLANGGAIYGGVGNVIEDCRFQDLTYECGILISTTFPVGTNGFSGTTIAQRCDLIRCGGTAGLQLCVARNGLTRSLAGINLNHLNITDSISDGISIIAPHSNVQVGAGVLSNAELSDVSLANYGLGGRGNALWARADAIGSLTVTHCTVMGTPANALSVPGIRNNAPNFTFIFKP
jgi:hypothetical protein